MCGAFFRQREQKMANIVDNCPICLEKVQEVGVVVLKCGHKVCIDCYTPFINSPVGKKCPICRALLNIITRPELQPAINMGDIVMNGGVMNFNSISNEMRDSLAREQNERISIILQQSLTDMLREVERPSMRDTIHSYPPMSEIVRPSMRDTIHSYPPMSEIVRPRSEVNAMTPAEYSEYLAALTEYI